MGPTTLLLPARIAIYADAFDVREVRTPNVSEAVFCKTQDGLEWIRKGPNAAERGTLSECVCWLLARELGLPVPPRGAVLARPELSRVWMSGQVMGSTWVPHMSTEIWDEDDLGRILAFDVWVDNGDRHERNIILEPAPHGLVRFCAIDFDGAGVGGFEAWDGESSASAKAPSQCPPNVWFSRFEWGLLDEVVLLAEQAIGELVARHDTMERVATEALQSARGVDPSGGTVDLLVRYLAWRSTCIHSMAKTYWQKAVDRG